MKMVEIFFASSSLSQKFLVVLIFRSGRTTSSCFLLSRGCCHASILRKDVSELRLFKLSNWRILINQKCSHAVFCNFSDKDYTVFGSNFVNKFEIRKRSRTLKKLTRHSGASGSEQKSLRRDTFHLEQLPQIFTATEAHSLFSICTLHNFRKLKCSTCIFIRVSLSAPLSLERWGYFLGYFADQN